MARALRISTRLAGAWRIGVQSTLQVLTRTFGSCSSAAECQRYFDKCQVGETQTSIPCPATSGFPRTAREALMQSRFQRLDAGSDPVEEEDGVAVDESTTAGVP